MDTTYMNKGTRDISIDLVKGLGIFCMVIGHSGSPLTQFIYLFHMAIFFIASGYCYKTKYSNDFPSLRGFIIRKFATLWLPYVIWTAIYSLLHNFFITINVYTDNPVLLEYVSGHYNTTTEYWTAFDIVKNILKGFLFRGGTQMGGAFWFIATLMELSIIYCVIDFGIKKVIKKDIFRIQFLISIIFLALGYVCSLRGWTLAGMDKVLSYYILFHGGIALKQYAISDKEREEYKHILILLSSFVILLACNQGGGIALGTNRYGNPLYFMVVSFVGWQFLYEIAYFIKKSAYIKKVFVCAGQNTMGVVILHFLCFKIVSYMGVLLYNEPTCLVAAFPVLYTEGYWWLAYTFVGLSVPIILSQLWKKWKSAISVRVCSKAKADV